ncbi:two-component system sporulation sensor kinase A [Evansella vedderi]|uniref:histidine kinase n=1 Tax=Evansella vedderi TaxID=38282 RepID=A0ABU0A0B0_9BACI|nr:ATP-binding protein [Evansella vedderi]MDQ0255775.1 two-component system sporulation sensor kinase A [Evansella vedderi]
MKLFDKLNNKETLTQINQLILDSVAEGIYGIDLEANVIFWNKAAEELTGFKMEDFEQHNLHDLIHHTNADGVNVPVHDCPVYHALNSGESLFVKDDIFWRKDGSNFPVEYTVKPMREDGQFVGTVITFRDMTEQKKTEEILLQWEKLSLMGQMAAGVAHEIRNPMTSLKGFLQLIKSSKELNNDYFEIMDLEIDRIESIIKELLTFSKPQKTLYTYVTIQDLIKQVILLMEPQAVMNSIHLKTNIETKPIEIFCIEYQLKQVFINLIKNAIEAMEKGGTITINLIKQGEEVVIQIIDEGTGIPPCILEKLGEPFHTTKENGTGLGIMVTNNIIKNHHKGKITVESQINEGTTFTITLPIKPKLDS